MAIISSFSLIRAVSLFHLTTAYFFLISPKTLADQNVVWVLGSAMRLPQAKLYESNEATAFIACLLAFFGLADLTAASLSDLVALEYWLSNVPVRLSVLFGVTGYVYLFKENGLLASQSVMSKSLCNSLTFSWAFLELVMWFWIYNSLREERHEIARKILQQKQERNSDNRTM